MKIVTKIWSGFALLIAGYVMTVIMTEMNSRRGEHFLARVEMSAFPCANAAQSAITHFKQQQVFFQDAVIFGEPAGVERATNRVGDRDHLPIGRCELSCRQPV